MSEGRRETMRRTIPTSTGETQEEAKVPREAILKIKILLIDLNRCRTAHDQMKVEVRRKQVDLRISGETIRTGWGHRSSVVGQQ